MGQITVENVSFNPVENQFLNGFIDEERFYSNLQEKIDQDPPFKAYKSQWKNVSGEVRKKNFSALDIEILTEAIRTAFQNEYQKKGLVLKTTNLVTSFDGFILGALVSNIREIPGCGMDKSEAEEFDKLIKISQPASRRKGAPSEIQYNSLPGKLGQRVDNVLNDIRQVNQNPQWTVARLPRQYTFPDAGNPLAQDVFATLRCYQGNHTNTSGWLPAVPTPMNQLFRIATQIQGAHGISPQLSALLTRTDTPKMLTDLESSAVLTTEYDQLRQPLLNACGDANILLSVWSAVAQEVSAYIEFNMGHGGISRLLYDTVNGHIYICAHYKWRNGYNPFFKVLNFPGVL